MERKRCTDCGKPKPVTQFFWRSRAQGIRKNQCKDCYREYRKKYHPAYYEKHKHEYRERTRRRSARVRAENQRLIIDYLRNHPCVSCGESDILVLDFDHRNRKNKVATISRMLQDAWSWKRILKEIAKCDVLCANCHRRKTAKQLGWYRAEVGMV